MSLDLADKHVTDDDYQQLLEFRTQLRRFLHWSEQEAKAVGLSPAQHQLLLVIRGDPDTRGPTISDVAERLYVRHHSAVELINRAVTSRLVRRHHDPDDQRVVRLRLTAHGAQKIRQLSAVHLEELTRLSGTLAALGSRREGDYTRALWTEER